MASYHECSAVQVRRRMQIVKQLPTRNDAVAFAQSKQTDEMRLEDVGGSPDRVEEYFSRMGSEMVHFSSASHRAILDEHLGKEITQNNALSTGDLPYKFCLSFFLL